MAGKGVATWVKVKNPSGRLTSRPISHKYEGGASFDKGQVITMSEYQKLKAEGNQKRDSGKTGEKAITARRVKTPEQISEQSARIVEKVKGRISKIRDKWGESTANAENLMQQIKDGKQKVSTGKKRKSSTEYGDIIKAEKVARQEMAGAMTGNDNSRYVKRQKLSNKKIQELNDKYNNEYDKQFDYSQRIKQLQKVAQNVSSKIR